MLAYPKPLIDGAGVESLGCNALEKDISPVNFRVARVPEVILTEHLSEMATTHQLDYSTLRRRVAFIGQSRAKNPAIKGFPILGFGDRFERG